MGEQQWGMVDDQVRRITTAFSGGLGSTNQELCGALSGGAMVIGVEWGRTSTVEDNTHCKALAAQYRDAFQQHFKYTICHELRANGWGGSGIPCRDLVAQAVEVLLNVMAETQET